MAAIFRFAAAICLLPFLATGASASLEMDAAFELPGWAESCDLPSATASSSIVKDSAFRLASNDQPAADSVKSEASCNEDSSCGACESGCGCSTWYGYAGAVILHRSRPENGAILAPLLAGPQINGGDFGFGWTGGVDVTIGQRDECCDGWEVRYFNDLGANAGLSFAGAPIDFRIAQGFPVNVIAVDATYATDLHSFEYNSREFVTRNVTLLSGFRYLEIDETLNFDLQQLGGGNPQYYWNDTNYLYGWQTGADVGLWGGNSPFSLNSIFKIGVYGLAADNEFVNTPAVGPVVQLGDFESDIAWVGEINLVATCQLCRNVALRGGYQLLWIENVAVASDQAINATTAGSGAGIDTNGELFYQGATTSLVFSW
jgi:hypothetical protein